MTMDIVKSCEIEGVILNSERVRSSVARHLGVEFEGNLTNAKWVKITKTSSSTALRDIQELVSLGILKVAKGGGRSTNYVLVKDFS